ncbi:MAG: 2,3-bisphosphoglycerate-independent phosphoglycerate mutase [Candidatus Eisenbacteria bacterium]|uniref:2,3-bisphosphoglycerate-independent phosphoglycerate mutase n=1 Tax=Eiseniibacteriota bacterium TaxID=2212470 RepID=A0A9D6L5Y7_UNCEI|nr:2,3-bisphosphoglycerate-independent phosphoglycerate mutase [Candidatus Eisenbacteria bacterium]
MSGLSLASLALEGTSRIVLLVLDGLGDIPDADQGGRTPLEAAATPNLDRLAPRAALGRLLPVAPGITPGSGPGHLALFGFDPVATQVGRGVLEALGAGVELRNGDVAARANFCTVDAGGTVVDRRAGRIASEVSTRLCDLLARSIGRIDDVEVIMQAGKGHRFVAVFRGAGLAGEVSDADPHREGSPIPAARPLAPGPEAKKTGAVVDAFVRRAREVLVKEHPANAVLVRGLSARPRLAGYRERLKLRAAAVAAYPMYRGVAQLAGMDVLPTGEKVNDAFTTVASRWKDFDFFFVHVKATDMAGEDGDFAAKRAAIEDVDRALPALTALAPDVLCVTGDHATPVAVRGHAWHPVPVMVHGRWCGADGAARFHERACVSGSLGVLPSRDLMAVLLANAGRLDKFGA